MDAPQQGHDLAGQEPQSTAMPDSSPEGELGTSSPMATPEIATSATGDSGAEPQEQPRALSTSRGDSPTEAATNEAQELHSSPTPVGTHGSSPVKAATSKATELHRASSLNPASNRTGTRGSKPTKTATSSSQAQRTASSPNPASSRTGTRGSKPTKTATSNSQAQRTASSPNPASLSRTGTRGSKPGETSTSQVRKGQEQLKRSTLSPRSAATPDTSVPASPALSNKSSPRSQRGSSLARSTRESSRGGSVISPRANSDANKPPGVSKSMKDGIKRLQSWVRPGPRPLLRGLFMMQRDDNGLNMSKFVELFDDGLQYSDAPADSSGNSSPFAPEGKIAMREVVDMEPAHNGFQLLCADGTKVFFAGPQNAAIGGTLDDWISSVGEHLDVDLEKRGEEPRPRGRTDPGEEVFACRVFRIVKHCPKKFPAWAVLCAREFRMTPVEVKEDMAEWKLQVPPPCYIDIEDIKEVKMTPVGFTVETTYNEKQEVEVPDEGELKDWADAWDSLLVDGFEKPGPGHWRRREIKKLHSCSMELVMHEETRPTHGVAYTNRLALYEDADEKDVLLEVWPSQVREVHLKDDGIGLVTNTDELLLNISNDDGDLDKTYGALQTCFARLPVVDDEEARRAASKLRNDINKRGLPRSADPRAIEKTMDDATPESDRAICQGMLAFYDAGKLKLRYGVLFPDRLQAWDSVDDLCNDLEPQVNLMLNSLASVEGVASGFILNCKQPANTKAGVYVGDRDELDIWIRKLQGALDKLRGDDQSQDDETTDSCHPPARFPQKAKPGFVPRCAMYAKQGEPPKRTFNKRNIKFNTHRAGWQAHGLISRSPCPNRKDLLGVPITDPIAKHADSRALIRSRYSMNVGLATKPNTRS